MSLPKGFVGAGLGFRKQPQLLSPLAERYPIVFHEVVCSIGTAHRVDQEHLSRASRCDLGRVKHLQDELRVLASTVLQERS